MVFPSAAATFTLLEQKWINTTEVRAWTEAYTPGGLLDGPVAFLAACPYISLYNVYSFLMFMYKYFGEKIKMLAIASCLLSLIDLLSISVSLFNICTYMCSCVSCTVSY